MDLYNVMNYGAVGNNSHDDGAGINAAIAAARADPAGKGTVYFPAGNYLTSQPLTLYSNVSVFTAGSSSIAATGTATDCFVFSAGNYGGSMYRLPNIYNFSSGAGLKFPPGAALQDIFIESIAGCDQAILIQATNGSSAIDQSINFNVLSGNTYAIMLQGLSGSNDYIQGLFIRGNFINGNKYSIFFTGVAGTSPVFNCNHFIVPAIEGGGGGPAGSQGITFDSATFVGGNVFDFEGFFGGFTNGYIVKSNGGKARQQLFRLGVIAPKYGDLDGINSGGFNTGDIDGNVLVNTNAPIHTSVVAATTASNTRSSFNGGNPVEATSFMVSLSLPSGLAAGSFADFYAYSPYCTGASAQPKFFAAQFGASPLLCTACEDESVNYGTDGNGGIASQIHIRLLAVGTVAPSTTVWGRLELCS